MNIKDAAKNLLEALGNPIGRYDIKIQTAIKMLHYALDTDIDRANIGQPSSHIPGNFTTHRASWRKALELAHDVAPAKTDDSDQKAYWAHEIAAYDRSFDRLLGTDSFTPPASLTAAVSLDEKTALNKAFGTMSRPMTQAPLNVGIPASQAQWPAPGTGRTFAGYSDPLDIESKVQAQARGPQPDHAHIQRHDLYTNTDKDAPHSIRDGNGCVVLDLCKRCGKGECELVEPCTPQEIDPTDPRDTKPLVRDMPAVQAAYASPAVRQLSDDDHQAALKMPADAGAVLGVLSGHNGELFDGTPANLDRLLPRYDPFEGQAVKHDGGDFYSRADVLRLFGNIV